MNKLLRTFLFWTPRILGILFILFVSLFALDIFEMGLGFWGTILGLFMHLLPSIGMTIALALAWRWEWVGTLGYFTFALWYIVFALGREMPWSVITLMAGIPALIGILFLVDWVKRREVRGQESASRLV
jgi:hypothetical protein